MRKDSDFEVTDRIVFAYGDNEKLAKIIEENKNQIASVTLALEIVPGTVENGISKEWDINGETAVFTVKKA